MNIGPQLRSKDLYWSDYYICGLRHLIACISFVTEHDFPSVQTFRVRMLSHVQTQHLYFRRVCSIYRFQLNSGFFWSSPNSRSIMSVLNHNPAIIPIPITGWQCKIANVIYFTQYYIHLYQYNIKVSKFCEHLKQCYPGIEFLKNIYSFTSNTSVHLVFIHFQEE